MSPSHHLASRGRILVAEDDPALRRLLRNVLAREGHEIRLASRGADALRLLDEESFDVVVADLAMAPVGGIEIVEAARRLRAETLVIVVAGDASVESAIGALRRGAHDYIVKPVRNEELVLLVDRALERLRILEEHRLAQEALRAERRRSRALAREIRSRFDLDKVLGRGEPMRRVRDLVMEVVNTDSTVLILGETGTGKGLLARVIHVNSPRAEGPFVEVNCAVYPEGILHGELCGREGGAAAGSPRPAPGRLEMARGGTLLLDEIAEASLPTQALLLRFLSEHAFERIGGEETIESDARVIASASKDIAEAIRRGLFRADLHDRLNVVPIHLPPLRERAEDLPVLAAETLTACASRAGRSVIGFTPEAMEAMLRHRWPGNIRELENVVERAVLLAHGSFIEPHHLPHEIASTLRSTASWLPRAPVPAHSGGESRLPAFTPPPSSARENAPDPGDEPLSLDEAERRHIVAVLRRCKGNKKRTAAALGINRSSLYAKLKRLGIAALLLAAASLAGIFAAEGPPARPEFVKAEQKIAPGLVLRVKDLVERGSPDELLPIIVQTWGSPGDDERGSVERLGGSHERTFRTIDAFAARLPARSILDAARHPRVKRISFDWPVRAHLDIAALSSGALAAVAGPSGTPLIGSGVTVAVLDSGVAPSPDFGPTASSIAAEIDVVEPDDLPADPFGHGTHVAGIIGGSGMASSLPGAFRTFRGVAPGARIVSVKVIDHEGWSTVGDVLTGVDWVIRNHEAYGIRVMNLSLGHPVDESYATDPLCQAVEEAWRAGIVVVVSAGNAGGRGYATVTSPANSPRVITVGAAQDWNTPETSDDLVASFSSLGPTALDGVIKPDLIAPGTGIVSLRSPGSYLDTLMPERRLRLTDFTTGAEDGAADSPYFALGGTSAAAAMVTGAAAILLQQDPEATPDDVKARLMIGARKLNDAIVARGAGLLDIPASLALGAAGLVADESRSPRLIVVARPDGGSDVEVQDLGAAWGDSNSWSSTLVWGENAIWGVSPLWADTAAWAGIAGPAAGIEAGESEIIVWSSP